MKSGIGRNQNPNIFNGHEDLLTCSFLGNCWDCPRTPTEIVTSRLWLYPLSPPNRNWGMPLAFSMTLICEHEGFLYVDSWVTDTVVGKNSCGGCWHSKWEKQVWHIPCRILSGPLWIFLYCASSFFFIQLFFFQTEGCKDVVCKFCTLFWHSLIVESVSGLL